MKKAVKIDNLHHQYADGTVSLENISLEIEEGERIAILGQNGAGKTTLFLHLNGSIKSPDDNVYIFGENVKTMHISERIHNVGIFFQDPDDQLFMPTIYDDVAFGPSNMGLSEDKIQKRVKEALATVGLSGFEERVPHHLSYGQKKRAALATVLAMKPKILVLDEPTANLDPKNQSVIINLINELNRDYGITTIVATHDVNAVSQLADRVFVLNKSIVAGGTPHEIFSDNTMLKENNLEAPEVYKVFKLLECYGCTCTCPPFAIPDVPDVMERLFDETGGMVQLCKDEKSSDTVVSLMDRMNY
jgi:cobalt/nickel transport system ATP-binding protein